jgi:hypothetical protein
MRRKLQKLTEDGTAYTQDDIVDAFSDTYRDPKKKVAPKRSYRSRKRKQEGSKEESDKGTYSNLPPLYTKGKSSLNGDPSMPPPVSPMSFGMPDLKAGFSSGFEDTALGGMQWMQSPMIHGDGKLSTTPGVVKRYDEKMFSPTALFGSPAAVELHKSSTQQQSEGEPSNDSTQQSEEPHLWDANNSGLLETPELGGETKKQRRDSSEDSLGSIDSKMSAPASDERTVGSSIQGSSITSCVASCEAVQTVEVEPVLEPPSAQPKVASIQPPQVAPLGDFMSPANKVLMDPKCFQAPDQILDTSDVLPSPSTLLAPTGETPIGKTAFGVGFAFTPSPGTLGAISKSTVAASPGIIGVTLNPVGPATTPDLRGVPTSMNGTTPSPQTLQSFFENVVTSPAAANDNDAPHF